MKPSLIDVAYLLALREDYKNLPDFCNLVCQKMVGVADFFAFVRYNKRI